MAFIAPSDVLAMLQDKPDLIRLLSQAVAKSNGRQTLETLFREFKTGHAGLWLGKDSAIVSEIRRYPTGDVWLCVRMGAGNMEELEKMAPELEEFAQEKGFVGVEGLGSVGFTRIGRKHGYKETHRFIEKRF